MSEEMQDLPKPMYWRVLIAPLKAKEMSDGGIALPTAAIEAHEWLNFVGRVAALGDLAFKSDRFAGQTEFPKVGDYVIFGRHAGQKMVHKEDKYIFINDDEILGLVSDTDALKVYV